MWCPGLRPRSSCAPSPPPPYHPEWHRDFKHTIAATCLTRHARLCPSLCLCPCLPHQANSPRELMGPGPRKAHCHSAWSPLPLSPSCLLLGPCIIMRSAVCAAGLRWACGWAQVYVWLGSGVRAAGLRCACSWAQVGMQLGSGGRAAWRSTCTGVGDTPTAGPCLEQPCLPFLLWTVSWSWAAFEPLPVGRAARAFSSWLAGNWDSTQGPWAFSPVGLLDLTRRALAPCTPSTFGLCRCPSCSRGLSFPCVLNHPLSRPTGPPASGSPMAAGSHIPVLALGPLAHC